MYSTHEENNETVCVVMAWCHADSDCTGPPCQHNKELKKNSDNSPKQDFGSTRTIAYT